MTVGRAQNEAGKLESLKGSGGEWVQRGEGEARLSMQCFLGLSCDMGHRGYACRWTYSFASVK